MCLAVPFMLKEINGDLALAEVNGLTQEISIALTPGVEIGDWVLVHAGFAIHKIDEDDAAETLKLMEEIYEADPG